MSTTRRTAGVHSRKRPLGPNGEKICYNCGGPLPKGRPFNCSPKCSEEWRCKTSPSHMRDLLHQRDKGICALCGTDTDDLKRQHNAMAGPNGYGWGGDTEEKDTFLRLHGVPHGRVCSDWWDADHIIPVIEGGGECNLSNFRTLCIPCHKSVTAELRARLAAKNQEAKDAAQKDLVDGLNAIRLEFGNTAHIDSIRTVQGPRRRKRRDLPLFQGIV
jgi:5-methylcytosine-specific restriction enzyme A